MESNDSFRSEKFYETMARHPYVRDVYLAYLIEGARRTRPDGFPIIEGWMIPDSPPKHLLQWDRRYDKHDPRKTGMCFYSVDSKLTPVLNSPRQYVDRLRAYECVVGLDASPYDNMPLVVQKSQIYINLAITYYFGSCGLKVIPNVRVGNNATLSSLEAYPKNHLICIGTNGFTHRLDNRKIFREQVSCVVESLTPSGILVYGPASDYVFESAMRRSIPIYQYDSYMMIRNRMLSSERKTRNGRHSDER